jgi:hypothetical protein
VGVCCGWAIVLWRQKAAGGSLRLLDLEESSAFDGFPRTDPMLLKLGFDTQEAGRCYVTARRLESGRTLVLGGGGCVAARFDREVARTTTMRSEGEAQLQWSIQLRQKFLGLKGRQW